MCGQSRLADGLSLVRLSFGIVNAYLLRGPQGDILIDTGPPGLAGRLIRQLRQAGSSPDRLSLILLTHVHIDHVGNLQAMQRLSGAPVLAHRLEAPVLESGRVPVPAGQTRLARVLLAMGAVASRRYRMPPYTPAIIADDQMPLHDFGMPGRVIHTPGHTAGSVSVLLESGDAIVGDLCQNAWGFGLGMGRIVLPLADLPEAVPGSWRRLIAEGAQRIHPGHGATFDAELLKRKLLS